MYLIYNKNKKKSFLLVNNKNGKITVKNDKY